MASSPPAPAPAARRKFLTFADANIPEPIILIGVAILVGSGTGLGAAAFVWLLGQIQQLTSLLNAQFGVVLGTLLAMVAAGLIVGWMVSRWAAEAKGHGVPEVMEAVALRGGRIRPRVALVKVLASSLTIGTGGSAGREGPIVQVGSALGSTIGQWLGFSSERTRTLVACGAAAGIAATFNAPIAGSLFALEVILGRFTVRYFGAVVISSVSASIIGRAFLGDRPAFSVPAYSLDNIAELPLYVALGVLAALVAVLFIRVLYRFEKTFDEWQFPPALKAALGMGLTAGVAFLIPGQPSLGPGLEFIGEAIRDDFELAYPLLIGLLLLKLLSTSLTLGSGNSGGVFAPGLYMGAVLGGLVGQLGQQFFPAVVAHPGAYAIVGMAAVFAGAARAPITAVLIVFEMSNDYRLILPLMMATVLSTIIAELVFNESIYTLKLKLKGIALQHGRDLDLMQSVMVEEVMGEAHPIAPDLPISEAANLLSRMHSHGFPIVDHTGELHGIITLSDIETAVDRGDELDAPVSAICTPYPKLAVAYPDETVDEILQRMGVRGLGRLPVVAREDPRRLLGIIRRDEVVRAYQLARARRAQIQHHTKQIELRNLDGTEFLDLHLHVDSPAVGQRVQDVAGDLPYECILVSVRRDGRLLIPHGDTEFLVGDQVTIFVQASDADKARGCLQGDTPASPSSPA